MKSFASVIMVTALAMLCSSAPAGAKDIGVAWSGKSSMTNRVYEGFKTKLSEIAPNINIDYKGELDSIEELGETAKAFEKNKDGMVILRSNGSTYLAKNPPSIPTFIGGGNHPEELGVIKDMSAPEGKITGVTYYLPLEGPIESFLAITPNVRSFLLITETGHESSSVDWKGTKAACDKIGLKCENVNAKDIEEAVELVSANKAEYDAFILGNQAKMFGSADKVVEAAGDKPVYSYAEKAVELGALGGVIPSDTKLGAMLAESVADVLINGKNIKDVPVKTDPEPMIVINNKTAKKLGLTVPTELLSAANVIN